MSETLPLSFVDLSAGEEAGAVCPSYFGDRRQHRLPADWPSPVSRFLAGPQPRQPGPTRRPRQLHHHRPAA